MNSTPVTLHLDNRSRSSERLFIFGGIGTRQSRIPIYGENRDDIIGILHARDLLALDLAELDRDRSLFIGLLRQPWFVPETKLAMEVFDSFRQQKRSFALTVDEYGGVTGLITMEDLLECIFGDIPSPSDQIDAFKLQELDTHSFSVDGMITLDEFNQQLGAALIPEEEDIATLGGLVLHAFGELPQEGQSVTIADLRFTASVVAQNRLVELHVERLEHADSKVTKESPSEAPRAPALPTDAEDKA